MVYRSSFPLSIFNELERIQRDMQQALGMAPAIRGSAWGGFPAMNMGHTQDEVLVYMFMPGVQPDSIVAEVQKGVLTVAGERLATQPTDGKYHTVHIDERFAGRFRRAVVLPDDVDDEQVKASYRDGVLYIRLHRRQEGRSRRLDIQ